MKRWNQLSEHRVYIIMDVLWWTECLYEEVNQLCENSAYIITDALWWAECIHEEVESIKWALCLHYYGYTMMNRMFIWRGGINYVTIVLTLLRMYYDEPNMYTKKSNQLNEHCAYIIMDLLWWAECVYEEVESIKWTLCLHYYGCIIMSQMCIWSFL